jgi:hypothetical protein
MGVLIIPDNVDLSNKEEIVRFIKAAGLVFSFDVLDRDKGQTIDKHFVYWDSYVDIYSGKDPIMKDDYTSKNKYRAGIRYITYDGRWDKYAASHLVHEDFFEMLSPNSLKGEPSITGYREAYVEETEDTPAYMKSYKIEMYDKY